MGTQKPVNAVHFLQNKWHIWTILNVTVWCNFTLRVKSLTKVIGSWVPATCSFPIKPFDGDITGVIECWSWADMEYWSKKCTYNPLIFLSVCLTDCFSCEHGPLQIPLHLYENDQINHPLWLYCVPLYGFWRFPIETCGNCCNGIFHSADALVDSVKAALTL